MSSSTSAASSEQPSKGIWPSIIPIAAASAAFVPIFRPMVGKSAEQMGRPIPSMSFLEGLKGGVKAAPTVGAIVGTQMVIQPWVEKVLVGESDTASLSSTVASSAIVATATAPVLAVLNGKTMKLGVRESLRRLSRSPSQFAAIAVQETGCIGGLSLADKMAVTMRRRFGDNKAVDYTAAGFAGALGSLAGHSGNTVLTWKQNDMPFEVRKLMRGAARRARALAGFSVGYKFVKEGLHSTVQTSK